ncbi:response regulator transcription factor [Subtercola endophyticus]|uniref:response regulator transcription factor n=1 Tax=Subtercola endophyticus TaxID=2895559 RepID=UPI001E2970AF|nr:response regulator transcription factor [Subtercola endophyticus]UFS57538.1 response regulator transcription factor [Subtercola endophyticus]
MPFEQAPPQQRGLVMIVEDDPVIADLERLYLRQAGFGVHTESNGERALAEIKRLAPVAIVLDVGLPGIDGITLCRRLRESGDWTPVVFVTARDEEIDRILGLELGADDYLTKPFSPRELVTRLRGILRRTAGVAERRPIEIGAISIDLDERTVRASGVATDLTATEFDLLAYLCQNPGRVFTRDQLLSAVWGQTRYSTARYSGARTVDVHVAQLRSKLGAASPILTYRGVGYSAAAPRGRQ